MASSSKNKLLQNEPPGPKQCHPSVGRTRPAAGCFPEDVLKSAAEKLGVKSTGSLTALRKALEKELSVEPEKEYSFLMKLPLSPDEKKALAKKYLRPPAPDAWKKDPDKWLDSVNIENVMNQVEEANPRFEFMGPFPIDFAAPDPYKTNGPKRCLMNEMCELRVQDAQKNGTDYIGIVYNLDPHYKSGSHWIANFINLKDKTCHFFDSYGEPPPPQVATFMKWLTTQDPEMKLHYNSKRLQYKNTECGVYCLMFITLMQYGINFVTIPRGNPDDNDMLSLRRWLFST